MVIQHPTNVPVRVRFIGWASALQFDGEVISGLNNDLRLQSLGYDAATERCDIEISGSASGITISDLTL